MSRAFAAFVVFAIALAGLSAQAPRTVTILADRLLDGRGGSLRHSRVTVTGDKIVEVVGDSSEREATYNLSRFTLLPGLIDTHVHILWHFGKDGRFDSTGDTPEERELYGSVENARAHRDRTASRRSRALASRRPGSARRARDAASCRVRAS